MRTTELIRGPQAEKVGLSLEQAPLESYEQRLIRWGCFDCGFYEKRVFRTGVISEELDAYIICRFADDPIDLIGEVAACPKGSRPQMPKNKSKSRWGKLHCVPRA
jgi:hypothetical protein